MIYQSMFNPLPDEDVYTKEEIDEALKNKIEAPMATPELGWFAGMGDAIGHGVASAGLKTASNAEEVLAGTVRSALSQYENETGEELPSLPGHEEQSIEEREQVIVEQIDAEAKELRRVAREEYGINEQTMGAASQVVFGLTEGLTKAIGYTMMMGPGLGAYAYGADYGMSAFHEARDEGVDFGTALTVGGVSAVSGALGLRIPATFGRSRTQSAVLGALVNMGFTGAEAETISFILDKQGYSKLAQRHQADITSLIVSGLFGGVMGGALYRAKPKLGEVDQRIEGEQAYQTPEEKYRKQLKDTGLYSTEQAEDLASIHGLANRNLAKLAGLSEEDAVAFTAEVEFTDKQGFDGLNQIERWLKDDSSDISNIPSIEEEPKLEPIVVAKSDDGVEHRVMGVNGNPDLTVLPDGVDGVKPLPVRLQERTLLGVHIRKHEYELKKAGYNSIEQAIVDISKNYYQIYQGSITNGLVLVRPLEVSQNGKPKRGVLHVELKEEQGIYRVGTVMFSSNKSYLDNRKLLLDRTPANRLHQENSMRTRGLTGKKQPSSNDSITQNEASVNGEFFQTAYHGTPHVFDKFNLKAIGTGEGAQAHGWGLYFAKNKAIAARYREYLTSKNTTPKLLYKGEPIENLPENVQSLLQMLTKNLGLSRDIKAEYDNLVYHFDDRFKTGDYVARIFEKYIDLIDKTPKLSITAFVKAVDKDDKYRIKYAVDAARNLAAQENRRATIQDVRKVLYEKFETSDNYRKEHKASLDALRAVDPEDLSIDTTSDKGRLFEVDIPEDTVLLDEQKYMGSSRDTELRSKIEWIIQEWDNKHPGNPLSLPESPNGREIYQAISDALGGPKKASLYLNRYGIKGITYDGLRDGRCYVVFDDEAIKVLDFYQKSMDQGQVRGSYNPKTNKIKLTPNADLSTFSHEMSHFYLDKMIDLSTNYSSVDYQVKTDMDNLLKYYGVKEGLKGWDSLDFEQQRKVQEQFASHSEIYLSTGKAPSRTLKRAFERLGMWILSVYRYLGGVEHGVSERYKAEFGEDLPSLSPEVKKVLDRLYSDIEAKAKEEVKNAKVDNETVAAARVLLTKIATNKKLMAILRKAKDRNAPLTKEEEEYATNMLRSLEIANNQINASQAVSVAQNFSDAPVDLDLIRKHSDQFVKTYNSGDVVLQNRDRSSKSSIAQMKSIASNPDYGRLGYSTSLANGAPVIGYADSIPAEQLGKESFMVDSEGKRYPTQYAVVDADSVLTSNAIDGTHNASYYEDNGAMKAIAGNGRITALNEAYRLGTIGKYLEEFKDDTLHGVPKAVIEKLKKPILVRIMRNEDITADIGDISNRSDSQQLSDVEQAMTDAQRINLDELRYTEDGDITADSVAQFLSVLPAEERARMIDSSGMPKKSAYARLERAIFQAAYGSPSATELLDSVEKTGVSRLLSAYRQLGTSLMGLAGELDFRPSMLDVLSEIRNAKLSGNLPSIQELASQVNITRSPEADAILRFLAKNEEAKGGVQGIVNTFRDLADFSKANMDRASQGADLFGEVVNPTRLDLMRKFSEITGVEIDEAAIQKAMDEAKQIAEAVQRATDEVVAKVEETQMIDETPVTQKDVESSAGLFEEAQALEAEREQAMKVLTNPEETMVQNLAVERPDAVYKVKDAEGNDVTLTAQEILEMNQKNLEQAKIEQSALGRAAECVINNNGLGV